MKTETPASVSHIPEREPPRRLRVNRRFSTQRRIEQLVGDLMRAHCGA